MEQIILIRHGQTSTSAKKLLHSRMDEEVLIELGRQQMQKTALRLKQFSLNKVYVSREKRAGNSAEIIASELGVPLEEIKGIEERDWGDFSGESWETVEEILGPMTLEERYQYLPPNGESWKQFEGRINQALDQILLANKGKTVVIVTHAGVIRALIPRLLGVEREETLKYHPANASITVFDHKDGKFSKVIWNDTAHLE
jgi:alpha-ribazole phosphatase